MISLYATLKEGEYLNQVKEGWEVSRHKSTPLIKIFEAIEQEAYNSTAPDEIKARTYQKMSISYEKVAYWSWWDNSDASLSTVFHRATQALLESSARVYKGKLAEIYASYVDLSKEEDKPQERLEYLSAVIDILVKQIPERQSPQGFVWKVTNAKGVDSYLIGTMHAANRFMVEAPLVREAMKAPQKLIFEFASPLFFALAKTEALFTRTVFFEGYLYQEAKQRGIQTEQLDTFMEGCQALYSVIQNPQSYVLSSSPKRLQQADLVEHARKSNTSIYNALLTEAWQNGNLNECPASGSHSSQCQRNRKWIDDRGLIQQLKNTNETITVAVGLSHLIDIDPTILEAASKEKELTIKRGTYNISNDTLSWTELEVEEVAKPFLFGNRFFL